MNKKTLFLVLLAAVCVFFPVMQIVQAATLNEMAAKAEQVAETVGTSIVVIGWIIAGILWLTSGGSPEKTGLAKKAILACVIGTILVVLAATDTIWEVGRDAVSI